MITKIINVYSGQYIIETAEVVLVDGKINSVELKSGKYNPVNPAHVQTQVEFWTKECQKHGWSTETDEMIGRGISICLYEIEPVHTGSEDYWLDSQFEDRYEMAGF